MSYSKGVWNQLKNTSADDLVRALKKDGWVRNDEKRGAIQEYRSPNGERITIHYHPGRTYGPKLLKHLLRDIGWSEADLKRLKLIK